jgi:hypothetical protein
MKILKILSSVIFCAAGLAALGASAKANIVPVVDPYFDMFPPGQSAANFFQVGCGPGCAFADKPVVGWTASATFQTGALSGQWQIGTATTAFNGPPIIAGTTTPELIVERDINATISQVVSTTALAGVTYTLDVDLGFNLGNRPDQAQMQGSGNWYDFQTSYTATSADAGDPIEILLSSLTGDATPTAWFADVRLVDSLSSVNPLATPEPATWAMMLLGFGGMAGVAAVRRRWLRRPSVAAQLA